MKTLIISLLSIVVTACTTGRQAQRSAHLQTRHSLYQDSSHLQAYGWQQQFGAGWQVYQADIVPVGPFTFHPDTGYRGTAAWLRISGLTSGEYRQSGEHLLQSRRGIIVADSGMRYDTLRQINRPNRSFGSRYGIGLLVLALLLLMGWRLWRR